MIRRCNQCGVEKPLNFDNFAKGGESNGGFCPYCRECSPRVQSPYREERKRLQAKTKIKELQNMGQMFFFNAGAY